MPGLARLQDSEVQIYIFQHLSNLGVILSEKSLPVLTSTQRITVV